jgi:ribosomal-protein-alanine N-acetyltransferase
VRLITDRLAIVPITPEFIEALTDRPAAARLIHAALPDGWPDPELAELLPRFAEWLASDRARVGYGPWVVIALEERTVVGSAGFLGLPRDGSIELGYGMHPAFRNRGYAAEAARALVDWGLDQPGVECIVSKTGVDNAPSHRVLEKLGFAVRTRTGEHLLWELPGPGG